MQEEGHKQIMMELRKVVHSMDPGFWLSKTGQPINLYRLLLFQTDSQVYISALTTQQETLTIQVFILMGHHLAETLGIPLTVRRKSLELKVALISRKVFPTSLETQNAMP